MPGRAFFRPEVGKQPYMDFWYNNTWVAEAESAMSDVST